MAKTSVASSDTSRNPAQGGARRQRRRKQAGNHAFRRSDLHAESTDEA